MSTASLSREKLAAAFRELGLQTGDSLIVHSAFSRLAPVADGPLALIDALLEVIGPYGNLMLPTFNYTRPLPEPYYDPGETPCRTGIIAELGRKHSRAVRSLHPTHSVAVIGPKAKELTIDHLLCRALGIGSPIDRLAQLGGKVLLLGVGQTSNSMIHIAEEYARIPKVSWYDPVPMVKVRTPEGKIVEHPLDSSPSCSLAFAAAEYPLRQVAAIRDSRIESCPVQLMNGKDVIVHVGRMLSETPDILLCTRPGCVPCAGARNALRQVGRSC